MVADDPWRNIIETRRLPAGTDLLRTYLLEILKYHDAGWRLHEWSTLSGLFIVDKDGHAQRTIRRGAEGSVVA